MPKQVVTQFSSSAFAMLFAGCCVSIEYVCVCVSEENAKISLQICRCSFNKFNNSNFISLAMTTTTTIIDDANDNVVENSTNWLCKMNITQINWYWFGKNGIIRIVITWSNWGVGETIICLACSSPHMGTCTHKHSQTLRPWLSLEFQFEWVIPCSFSWRLLLLLMICERVNANNHEIDTQKMFEEDFPERQIEVWRNWSLGQNSTTEPRPNGSFLSANPIAPIPPRKAPKSQIRNS